MKALIIIFFLSPILLISQPLEYQKVIEVKDSTLTAEQLYNQTKIWVAENYISADKVIDMDVKAQTLIVKGQTPFSMNSWKSLCVKGKIWHQAKFEFKTGKVRLTLTNFSHDSDIQDAHPQCVFGLIYADSNHKVYKMAQKWSDSVYEEIVSQCNQMYLGAVNSLTSSLNSIQTANDDW